MTTQSYYKIRAYTKLKVIEIRVRADSFEHAIEKAEEHTSLQALEKGNIERYTVIKQGKFDLKQHYINDEYSKKRKR